MNCAECQELLQLHLDGEPVADRPDVGRHLRDCPECRGLHAAVVRLEEGLRLFTPPLPPRDFALGVVAAVFNDQRARRRRVRRWVGSAALAAGLLLAVWLALPNGGQGPVAQPRTPPEKATESVVARESSPSPLEFAAQSGAAVAGLPRRMAAETRVPKWTLPENVLPELPRVDPDAAEPALEKATASLTEAKQGASLAWQAVETPMRRATGVWSRLTPTLHND